MRVAQNVGKVWISRTKILLAPFGAILGSIFAWTGTFKNKIVNFCLFSLVDILPHSVSCSHDGKLQHTILLVIKRLGQTDTSSAA